jgi:hypothetical protein
MRRGRTSASAASTPSFAFTSSRRVSARPDPFSGVGRAASAKAPLNDCIVQFTQDLSQGSRWAGRLADSERPQSGSSQSPASPAVAWY